MNPQFEVDLKKLEHLAAIAREKFTIAELNPDEAMSLASRGFYVVPQGSQNVVYRECHIYTN